MQEEIRVMTLVRKAKLTQREKTLDKGIEERFYTTDYFDMLIAKKYSLDVPLNQWMSEDIALTDYSQETAVQRYPLYFSRQIYEKYEHDQNVLKRGDPFEKGSEFKFLSVIQIYIAPEIWKRLGNRKDVVWHAADDHATLDPFLDDLYDTVECFRHSYQNQEFVYRIYYALSAGDFTIVIKSRTPELSFGISTYLRSRITGKKWAVYKTYTLLAMEDDIEGWENGSVRLSDDGNIGKFVLRGCYSWKYWAECSGNEDIDGINRLNGRYDISAELTEREFELLYHKVAGNGGGKKEATGGISGKVNYLADLMDKEHLSYINERYLMHGIEIKLNDVDTVSSLVLDNNVGRDFYYLNQEFIEKLRQKQNSLKMTYAVIYREHKSLRYYFELLKRQIDFCSVLNEQSDTRLYASGMEQLLGAVLDALGEYRDVYLKERERLSDNESSQIGELIVKYLGKSVYSINTYMEYVRNNNLQSLQTPNYNIESDMGMEKVLIGYSEYLREFVRFYVKNSDCMSDNIGFLPIVVPNICYADISVEVLFPDDKIFNLTEDKMKGDEKLLIINSPSMVELEDVPMALAMLCHEIAHQFRYESREERNNVLLQLFAVQCADVFVEKILANLQAEIGESITFPAVKTILQQELSQTIREILTSSKYGITMDAPLDYLNRELEGNLSIFFRDFSYISKLDKYVQLFIRQVNEWENVDVSSIEAIVNFYSIVHLPGSKKSCLEEIKKTAEKYVSEMVGKGEDIPIIYLYMDDLLKQLAAEDQDDIDTAAQEYIVQLHKRLNDIWQEKTLEYADKIGEELSAGDYRMWALSGRYLGLDAKLMEDTRIHEKNKERFFEAIRQVKFEREDMEAASVSISTYREITSDIFMCCVMGISPFAYLNVIVTNMWRADLIMNFDTMETMERIITVILMIGISNKNVGAKQALKEYNVVCMEILDKTGDEIRKYVPEEYEEFKNLSLEISEELEKDSEEHFIRIQEQIEKLEQFRKNMEKKYEYKSDLHLKIDKILLVCRFLICEGETYIDKFYKDVEYPQICDWEFLKEDYDTARQVLSEFREKMKGDVKMAQLDRLHCKISGYLERLYETGRVSDGDLNRETIEYLLKMYYNYKFQHAGSGEEE